MITRLPPDTITNLTGLQLGIGVSLSYTQAANSVTITPDGGSGVTIPAASASAAGMLDAARATIIDGLETATVSFNDLTDKPDRTAFFSLLVDGGGGAIVAPITRYFYMPFAATLTGWVIMADQSGTMTIDVWKTPFASGFPPTVANSITGGSPMALAAQSASAIPIPAAWTTTSIASGDCLAFNISASATVNMATVQLVMTH